VQRPIPILVGGHSDVALERAGRIGDGWIAAQMSPERVVEHWPRVRESAERSGRDPASLQLFTSTPVRNDRSLGELLAQYREIGVDHVQVGLHRSSRAETLDTMRDVAENVIPGVRD
jgi:alkanesulfonate monooxygenase SsuD/methylene tetrahydromethanopterin reductase-like flavin-dependent oxidoreductase (luciferase family)